MNFKILLTISIFFLYSFSMNSFALITASFTTITLIISIYILYLNPKKFLHILFFSMMILISFWNFVAIRVLIAENKETIMFWYRVASPSLLFVPITLHIVMLIVNLNKKLRMVLASIIYLCYLFFIYQHFNFNLIYKDFVQTGGVWSFIRVDACFVSVLYTFSFFVILFFAMLLLINRYRKITFLREKKQALVLFSSIGLLFIILLVDFISSRFFPDIDFGISAHYIFIWPIGIGIAIVKYGFLTYSTKLFADDVFENIEESVLVLDCNKKIIIANSNAKKMISENITGSELSKYILEYNEINEKIDNLLKGQINYFKENITSKKDDKSKLIIQARFSVIKDKYNDRIGVLIIGQELKGLKEFATEYKISGREWEVIRSVTTGLSNREIAEKLDITETTIKSHIMHIYDKLDIKNKVELINILKRYGLA
ncbi:MAG: LuxR C-terminal-related transcriptional regulator [Spirochaetota bacterium]